MCEASSDALLGERSSGALREYPLFKILKGSDETLNSFGKSSPFTDSKMESTSLSQPR